MIRLLAAALLTLTLAACDSAFEPSACTDVEPPGLRYDAFLSDPGGEGDVLTARQNTDGANLIIQDAAIGDDDWTLFHIWRNQRAGQRSIFAPLGRDYRAITQFTGCPASEPSPTVTLE